MTPMEAVDEQVREFTRTALDREGVVTGWVLMVATSRLDEDGDAIYGYDCAAGLDTPLITAVGLVELCRRRMYRHCGVEPTETDDDG